MEGTYIFYTFLMLSMVMLSSTRTSSFDVTSMKDTFIQNVQPIRISAYIIIISYSLVIGCRYLVGVDYATYLGWYKYVLNSGVFPPDEDKEFGYITINLILASFRAHYSFLFIIIAFLQIYFIYNIFRYIPIISKWYIFFFFTSLLMFSSMNIMRQTLAYFIFVGVLLAVNNKEFRKAIIFGILGFSFHKSIILGILFIPLLKYDWFKRRDIQFICLALFSAFSYFFLSLALNLLSPITTLLGYNYYVDNIDAMYELTADNAVGSGFGIYLFILIDAIIVYFSKELKEKFEKVSFTKYYNLYFLGILLDNLFRDNFVLSRTNDYFLNFRVIVLSFLMIYLSKTKMKYSANYFIIALIVIAMLAYFYRGIENSAAKSSPFRLIF